MIEKAIELLGLAGVGRAAGVSPQAVHKWKVNGVPAVRVKSVVLATGHAITPHDLRPDLYPPGFQFPNAPEPQPGQQECEAA